MARLVSRAGGDSARALMHGLEHIGADGNWGTSPARIRDESTTVGGVFGSRASQKKSHTFCMVFGQFTSDIC